MSSIENIAPPFKKTDKHLERVSALTDIFSGIIANRLFTETELDSVGRFYEDNQIEEESRVKVMDEAFDQAVQPIILRRDTTTQEIDWLLGMANQFAVSPKIVSRMEESISALRKLTEIQTCDFSGIPKITPEATILKPGEYALLEVEAFLVSGENAHQTSVRDSVKGSFRLAPGIHYEVGEKKSALSFANFNVESNRGYLILTNQRLIFSGGKVVSLKISSLFKTAIFANSIQFGTIEDENLTTIGFDENLSAEYCGTILSRLINK